MNYIFIKTAITSELEPLVIAEDPLFRLEGALVSDFSYNKFQQPTWARVLVGIYKLYIHL